MRCVYSKYQFLSRSSTEILNDIEFDFRLLVVAQVSSLMTPVFHLALAKVLASLLTPVFHLAVAKVLSSLMTPVLHLAVAKALSSLLTPVLHLAITKAYSLMTPVNIGFNSSCWSCGWRLVSRAPSIGASQGLPCWPLRPARPLPSCLIPY